MELKYRHDEAVTDLQSCKLPEPAEFVEGVGPAMRSVQQAMHEVAQSQTPVLLLAERGSGKRTVARRIHDLSPRAGEPFCIIRCASLGFGQFGELRTQTARQGTAYLDEVSDLSCEGQSTLLKGLTQEN
jgi:DNA-binding NtrC family response regulator